MSTTGFPHFNCSDQVLPSWHDRAAHCTALIAQLSPMLGTSFTVGDVGCGDCKLQGRLTDAGLAVEYHGFDLIPQTEYVQKFDIQSQNLPLRFDVLTLLGVVEYLDDLPRVFQRLSGVCQYLVVSYVVQDFSSYAAHELQSLGWRNHLDRRDFVNVLTSSCFEVLDSSVTANGRTVLWLCRARPIASHLA